jgi:hypothetical protein
MTLAKVRKTKTRMNSPTLLTSYEPCNRCGIWDRDWERIKITLEELLQAGIKEGVTTTRQDIGEAAGERIMEISASREIVSDQHDIYNQVVHYASIADIVSTAVRKPSEAPWGIPESASLPNGQMWHSGAFLSPDGTKLRRIALTSNWSDAKHYSFARSWYSLGETAIYNMPMQQVTIILGQNRDGKRHGYWSHGLRHPVSKQLRFRKKNDKTNPFKSSWIEVWREDYNDISTSDWLSAMMNDGVLSDVAFTVDVPVPERDVRKKLVDLAARRLDEIYAANILPDKQLSTCDWPEICDHRNHCHADMEPSGRYGFVKIDQLG